MRDSAFFMTLAFLYLAESRFEAQVSAITISDDQISFDNLTITVTANMTGGNDEYSQNQDREAYG